MSLKSKLGMEDMGLFAAFAFYGVVGILCFAALAIVDFRLVHIGIIGILSLATAYGLSRNRVWALWSVIVLFFMATTFSLYSLYFFWGEFPLLDATMIAYLILSWVFTIYVAARRRTLES